MMRINQSTPENRSWDYFCNVNIFTCPDCGDDIIEDSTYCSNCGGKVEWYEEEPEQQIFCSFCGKEKSEVGELVAGPAVYICKACANRVVKTFQQEVESF